MSLLAAYSFVSVICSKVTFSLLCFSLTSPALLYAFLMWLYSVFHEVSTSVSDVESLLRFFWICSALSEISIALSPTDRRFRFMDSVAGETRSTRSFAASATRFDSHSVRYWYTASEGMNPKAKVVVPSSGLT